MNHFDNLRLVVDGKTGLVAREPGLVLVIPNIPTTSIENAERLVRLCLAENRPSSEILLRRIAYLLGESDQPTMPGFGLLVSHSAQRSTLFLHGALDAVLPGECELVSSAGYSTWIERPLVDVEGLVIKGSGAPALEETWRRSLLDLREGVVPGGTAFLRSRNQSLPVPQRDSAMVAADAPVMTDPMDVKQPTVTRPHVVLAESMKVDRPGIEHSPAMTDAEPPTEPYPASDHPASDHPTSDHPTSPGRVLPSQLPGSFESVQLVADPMASTAPPLPTTDDERRNDRQVFVEGIVFSRGHFNDPGSAYCSVCGISMVHRTHEFVSAPRPPLGVLVFDDGCTFSVDGDYVVGREPELDPAVMSEHARPLCLNHEDQTVSRVHAVLRLVGWQVLLEDRGSSNGTFVAHAAGDQQWQRIEPGHPATLTSGDRVRFGHKVAVFEAQVRAR